MSGLLLVQVLTVLLTLQDARATDRHGLRNFPAERYDYHQPRAGCGACIAIIGTAQNVIRSENSTDEEIMDAAVDACYQLVPNEGYNPDTLCQLSIDTYGPHVIYILNVTSKTPVDICTLYNHCNSAKRRQTTQATFDVPRRPLADWPKSARASRQPAGTPRVPDDFPSAIKVVHITDIHTDYDYAEGAPTDCDMPLCCRTEYNGNGSARYWGDYPCNIPHRTLDLMFNNIATLLNGHNFVLVHTGDHVQHTVWDQPFNQTVNVSQYITERIAYHFPGVPAFYGAGNHDICPTNLFNIDRPEIQELNAIMFSHWQPLSSFTSEQQTTFEQGLYYSVLSQNHHGLRFIGYNSIYGALENFYTILNVDGPDYPAMQQFMEQELSNARLNNEKVILVGHHTTGSSGCTIEYSDFITDIHSRYSDVILLHLLGHKHGDVFKLVKDLTTNQTRGVQLSSPAMTSYTDNNPSFRIIYLDHNTYQPIDMDVYHLDLNVDADNPNPDIKFIYRMSEEYNMTDMSPQSFDDLTNRMEADRDILNLYLYNKDTRVFEMPQCDDECAHEELCDIRYTDYERREDCMTSFVESLSNQ